MLFINLTTKFSVVCSLKLGASFIKISSLQKVQLFSLESERSTYLSNVEGYSILFSSSERYIDDWNISKYKMKVEKKIRDKVLKLLHL